MSISTKAQIHTFFSPDDDTQKVFLDFIRSTKQHLRIAIYSLHLPPLVDDLIQLHRSGVNIALVCDHSQAEGRYEHPEIEQLRLAGVPFVVGTSQKHKIMHHKFAVKDKVAVESGSWNFSLSASEESNYFDIIESWDRAATFLSKWQEMWNWISENEPQLENRV
jgi:phosphatidylserine/phosphatidylglycerophosphate/cardiolipin synthase-like enzyme